MAQLCYRRHRSPPEIIQHAIWLYLGFTLSYRDVEELLAARGHCQLKRPWYAHRVGGAAARVGELLSSPITLPRSDRAGPAKGALGPLS